MSEENATYPPPLPDFVPEHFWNLDLTLAGIIAKALAQMMERDDCGIPGGLTEDEWRGILGRMAAGFQRYYANDAAWNTDVTVDEEFDLLKKWFGALWT